MTEKKPQSKANKPADNTVSYTLKMDATIAGEEKQKGDTVTLDKATADWLDDIAKAQAEKTDEA